MAAAKGGNAEVVKLLIENGAEVNGRMDNGVTALIFAAGRRVTWKWRGCSSKGAAKSMQSTDVGETALMSAAGAKGDHVELVKLLIEKGADINAKDEDGVTALYIG